MRLETITRETGIDLLRIAFFLVWKLHELGIQGVDTNPKTLRRRETNSLHIGMGDPFLEHCSLISFFLKQLQPSGTRLIEHAPIGKLFEFVR
jgi:hypothetical protein